MRFLAWITVEYSKVGKNEKDHVDVSRKNIIGNIEKLRELVGFLGSAEHEGVVHPKLEKVVEKSLPLYKKAILSALNRQFPENPDEFYFAVNRVSQGVPQKFCRARPVPHRGFPRGDESYPGGY